MRWSCSLAVAEELQASPYPSGMIIALAAPSAFMTPVSPVNTLVATAGNYDFMDFVRIGLPFTLIVMAVSVWLFPGCSRSIDPRKRNPRSPDRFQPFWRWHFRPSRNHLSGGLPILAHRL